MTDGNRITGMLHYDFYRVFKLIPHYLNRLIVATLLCDNPNEGHQTIGGVSLIRVARDTPYNKVKPSISTDINQINAFGHIVINHGYVKNLFVQ